MLAGSGMDDPQVAYVKTVRPGEERPGYGSPSDPVSFNILCVCLLYCNPSFQISCLQKVISVPFDLRFNVDILG